MLEQLRRTVKSEPICVLDSIFVSQDRDVTCNWYQKLAITETILDYRSCARTQYKRRVIQRTVH